MDGGVRSRNPCRQDLWVPVEADTKVLDDPEYLIPWELWCYYVWGFGISSMNLNNSSSAQDEVLWTAASAAKQWSQRFRPAAPQVRTRKALAGNPGKHLTQAVALPYKQNLYQHTLTLGFLMLPSPLNLGWR